MGNNDRAEESLFFLELGIVSSASRTSNNTPVVLEMTLTAGAILGEDFCRGNSQRYLPLPRRFGRYGSFSNALTSSSILL
jgi:hypothetical protein